MSSESEKRTCYLVVVEVSTKETATAVKDILEKYDAFCPITDRCWAVVSDEKASVVRDKVSPVLRKGDRIFVFRSGTVGAWQNAISDKHSEWLKKYL